MEILFDNIIFAKEKQGGISNYWFQIIKNYINDINSFFYEEPTGAENIFRKQLTIKNTVEHFHLSPFLARLLPIKYTGKSEVLLYHSSFYRKLLTNSKVCEITTVHDFLHNRFSTYAKRLFHNALKYNSIERAKGIICVSGNTIKDLKKYCPPTKNQKVALIYNGVSDDYKPLEKKDGLSLEFLRRYDLNEKFILYVGARSSYKNFDFILQLLENLPAYKLVVVGNVLSKQEDARLSPALKNRMIIANNISDAELNFFYNYAHALIYPSSYEGFGIPVIEAMKAGCPVLALNNSSIPEISGGAAKLFENLNISQFVQEVSQLENQDYRAQAISEGLNNAKRFSWNKCAKETSEFYNEVYNSF